MGTTVESVRGSAVSTGLSRIPFVGAFARFVGPAALTAAGMIGAGAVATRLLAGAWFGFDLLWVALYVVPMVVITHLLKAILAMVGNLILAPVAVLVIMYFVNQK